jgi:hypothetical protein
VPSPPPVLTCAATFADDIDTRRVSLPTSAAVRLANSAASSWKPGRRVVVRDRVRSRMRAVLACVLPVTIAPEPPRSATRECTLRPLHRAARHQRLVVTTKLSQSVLLSGMPFPR